MTAHSHLLETGGTLLSRSASPAHLARSQSPLDAFVEIRGLELAALRPLAEPLLLQVEPGTLTHIEANRLLSFLRWVHPLSRAQQDMIPDTSLLREFIGGSILHEYLPGGIHRHP